MYQNNVYKSKPLIPNFDAFLKRQGIVNPNKMGMTKKQEIAEANKVLDELGISDVLRSIQLTRNN